MANPRIQSKLDGDIRESIQTHLSKLTPISIENGKSFAISKELCVLNTSVAIFGVGFFRYVGVLRDFEGYPISGINFQSETAGWRAEGATNAYGCFVFMVPVEINRFSFSFPSPQVTPDKKLATSKIDVPLSMALSDKEMQERAGQSGKQIWIDDLVITWEPATEYSRRKPEVILSMMDDEVKIRFAGSLGRSITQTFRLGQTEDVEPRSEGIYFVFPREVVAGKAIHVELGFRDHSIAKVSFFVPA